MIPPNAVGRIQTRGCLEIASLLTVFSPLRFYQSVKSTRQHSESLHNDLWEFRFRFFLGADSDESGHLFQSISDTIPILSDSCRSEATLRVSHNEVSDRSQVSLPALVLIR